jgi:predicted HTH domain antitoxin
VSKCSYVIRDRHTSHIEKHLQSEWGNELPRRAAEALAIEGYRSGALSLGEVAEMLSLSIDEADGFLKERNIFVIENLEEIETDNRVLKNLLTK